MSENVFLPARVLLPKKDFERWSVVACDQYTSQPAYWEQTEAIAKDVPSALHLILPELYLDRPDTAARVGKIHETMRAYLSDGTFAAYDDAMIYVRRTQSDGSIRQGVVGKLDLLAYDFHPGSHSPVRATEGTVLSRIPPRLQVREGAPLELPHVLILIDDPDCSVIEPCAAEALQTLYDFNLMQDGGHITGGLINPNGCARVQRALAALPGANGGLWFAVGDGNHSLATAKTAYENLRATMPESEWLNHPARYALVEIVNLRDDAIRFEPIHRVVFGVDPENLLTALRETTGESPDGQLVRCIWAGGRGEVRMRRATSNLPVGTLQSFLDAYLAKHPEASVDYIHGDEVVEQLAAKPGAVGFLLPPMPKDELFRTVEADGALPRKTFSMGHAQDKRYYLETREIL